LIFKHAISTVVMARAAHLERPVAAHVVTPAASSPVVPAAAPISSTQQG
jgi:hypothetical protein